MKHQSSSAGNVSPSRAVPRSEGRNELARRRARILAELTLYLERMSQRLQRFQERHGAQLSHADRQWLHVARHEVAEVMAAQRGNRDKGRKAVLFDSTVIREAQEAMDFMANVLEASTEYSIIGKDLDGKILLWNEGARRMYGYEPEEVVGRANAEILHTPEDVAVGMPQRIMDIAMHNGKWEGVIGRVRKDRKRITARVVMTPRRDASGSPIGYLLISKDISNELRFTDEVRKAKLFDSAIVGSAQEAVDFITNILQASTEYAIIGKSLDGTILLWNEGARRLYGYEPEEVVGKANTSILHAPEDVVTGRYREFMDAALHDGKWEGTINRVRKNGERFTARVGVQSQPVVGGPRTAPVRLQGLPVLVVDDNATNRRILAEVLTHWGMRPTVVDSGPAALATLESARDAGTPIPLVLLDAHMPGTDGWTLASEIQQDPTLRGAIIMMLTS